MALVHITKENFEKEVKQAKLPVLIDFWAAWCGPCRMMGPVFDELSNEYKGKIVFAKLDTENEPLLASQFGIQGIPTLALFQHAKEVGRVVGFAPKPVLKQKIDELLVRAK